MSRKTIGLAWSLALVLVAGMAAAQQGRSGPGSLPVEVIGKASRIRDGDTLEVGGIAVRLQGVAAPELHEPLGTEAKRQLEALVGDRTLRCRPDGSRSHDRIVAQCRIGRRDLSEALVRQGLARDCPRFSNGRYAVSETAAQAAGAAIRQLYPLPPYCRRRGGR